MTTILPLFSNIYNLLQLQNQTLRMRVVTMKFLVKTADELKLLGIAEFTEMSYDKAIDYFSKAILKKKDSTDLFIWRAISKIGNQDIRGALDDCNIASSIAPRASRG